MKKYITTTYRLWILLKPFHNQFYLQLFFIVLSQLIAIFSTVLLAKSINGIVDKNFMLAMYLVISFAVLSAVRNFVNARKDISANRNITYAVQQYLQEHSFKKIFRLNASQYIEDHSAIRLQVINRGEAAIENIITTILLNLVPTATQVIFSLIAIAYYDFLVALISLLSLVVAIAWTNRFTIFHRPFIRRHIEQWDIQNKIRTEGFQHLSLVKLTGVEDGYLKKYLKNRFAIIEQSRETKEMSIHHNTRRGWFFNLANCFSRLYLVYLAFQSKVMVGDIYAIWTWIGETNSNIYNVLQAMRSIPINFVELDKYLAVIDKEPLFDENGLKKIPSGDIVFNNLTFKYPKGEQNALSNISLTIPKGKKVGFVGFSGSGKTTITRLLLRIYDYDSGEITIGGKSLKDLDAKALRKSIGYVEQHVDLFDASIKENILLGIESGKIDEEKIQEIAKLSRITEFYNRLGEKGLDTVIGEKGIKLSGGERQRIGIARAVIKEPEILIFDEATASLDNENEKYIQEAIDATTKNRTTIVIAHRLSTVKNSDIIFVMDKGVLVDSGTHEELAQSSEVYKRLLAAEHRNQ
jgi:ABC-type multidrug transport system fused ATPase/permease subunit